jgi:hypothetical protein
MTPEERAVIEAARRVADYFANGFRSDRRDDAPSDLMRAVSALQTSLGRFGVEHVPMLSAWCVMTPASERVLVGWVLARCYRKQDAERIAAALNRPAALTGGEHE